MTPTVAIIGCGLIGRAWTIVFARAGCPVRVWDANPEVLQGVRGALKAMCDEAGEDLGILDNVTTHPDMAGALEGAAWVQENGPEKLDIKRAIYADLDRLAAPDAVLASSSSALVASSFNDGLSGRGRILVAHPVNPPHVIPVVELCPSPDTTPEVMDRAEAFMTSVKQVPVRMSAEIDGFVLNRLQAVLLAESLRLVAEGIVTAKGVDDTLRHGLAQRWVLLGALETINLNAPGGVADYLDRYGPTMARLSDGAARGEAFTPEVARQLASALPAPERVPELTARRDRDLTALAGFLQTLTQKD
ncbi:3-hydroxyacyl-CoA dehydrogenase [Citreicella sp. C3M06]|uniref:3-hydroxyacyl-CoA dehydrogenase NAD-binding domain-containing protein n=1 Tax=Citreicella sp. C3M06 TaxID=2841564 RepID=UPI001C09A655|nr:3-hydroxyacyl-CoA dehydrogenase NAD-binding domain-containing protein [Citreicella sp. C3M06]MBU2960236.1 3-hydroxyacyl-CoA dehydrogenase [Citreicella sp. C3M06]